MTKSQMVLEIVCCADCGIELPIRSAKSGEPSQEWYCMNCGQYQPGVRDECARESILSNAILVGPSTTRRWSAPPGKQHGI